MMQQLSLSSLWVSTLGSDSLTYFLCSPLKKDAARGSRTHALSPSLSLCFALHLPINDSCVLSLLSCPPVLISSADCLPFFIGKSSLMRLGRAIDPPVGCLCCCCCFPSSCSSSSCCCCCSYILYFCVRVFLIGFFIGSFSPDCSIFQRGSSSPSLSLSILLLARFCRVLCGFRSQDVSVFSCILFWYF